MVERVAVSGLDLSLNWICWSHEAIDDNRAEGVKSESKMEMREKRVVGVGTMKSVLGKESADGKLTGCSPGSAPTNFGWWSVTQWERGLKSSSQESRILIKTSIYLPIV